MPKYVVPVHFKGHIEYEVEAPDGASAMARAGELADEEGRLGALEDLEWDVRPPYPGTGIF